MTSCSISVMNTMMSPSLEGGFFPGISPTVDGRNPANQLICKISHYLQGFVHLRWLFGISSINSSYTYQSICLIYLKPLKHWRSLHGLIDSRSSTVAHRFLRSDHQKYCEVWRSQYFGDVPLSVFHVFQQLATHTGNPLRHKP